MTRTSEQLNELFTALSKAQGQIRSAIKDSQNSFFKSSGGYASLDSCWEACRGPLFANNLTIVQTMEENEGKIFLCTILGHSSGQFIESRVPLLLAKQDPQAIGSALTYMRRYCLCAIVGVTPGDDDDGEKAMVQYRKPEKMEPEEISSSSLRSMLGKAIPNHDLTGVEKYLDEVCKKNPTKQLSPSEIIKTLVKSPERMERFLKEFEDWKVSSP
jgi:hypothetical protein